MKSKKSKIAIKRWNDIITKECEKVYNKRITDLVKELNTMKLAFWISVSLSTGLFIGMVIGYCLA